MPRTAIGIDIGGTLTKLAIVSEEGEILHSEALRTAGGSGIRENILSNWCIGSGSL